MTPDEHTNQEVFLDVGDGHQLYIHDWGKGETALPIMVFHGGPGNGVADRDKKNFDPKTQRIIFHDQRGAGRSLSAQPLKHNTTQDLVEDIEKIARRLELDRFVVTGGSWGSTLALAYGISYPKRVAGMVLNGIFTGKQDEIDWLATGGYQDFFPDVWRDYVAGVPASHRHNPTAYHLKQAFGSDAEAAKKSAYAYETMELALLKLDDRFQPGGYATYEPAVILFEMYYLAHKFFLEDDYILRHASKLTMPIIIVQGRYDMVCRPIAADRLHQVLPDSQLIWTINGHLGQHESRNIQRLLLKQAARVT